MCIPRSRNVNGERQRHSDASSLVVHVRGETKRKREEGGRERERAAFVRNRNRRVRRDNLPSERMELLDKLTFHRAGANSRLHGRKHPDAVSVSPGSRVNNMTNGDGDVPVCDCGINQCR